MSEDDLYFRNDLTAGIEPILLDHGLTGIGFTWSGSEFTASKLTPAGEDDTEVALAAIKAVLETEINHCYPENRNVPFRYALDLAADACSLLWGLEDE